MLINSNNKSMNVVLLIAASLILLFGFVAAGPLHASCKVAWVWPNYDCKLVKSKLVAQMNLWATEDNCKNGGEKCLYSIKSQSDLTITGTHMTPVKHYVDDLTFSLQSKGKDCLGSGYSTSETWYAVLDFGTNYCNLENLITGSGLDKVPGFAENTNDSICTQYSSANCTVY